KTYWFSKADGHMYTGWRKLSGYRYYFGSDGAMRKSQWVKSGGYWHYCMSSGKLATGVRTINGSTYGFNKYGHMYTGKHVINGKTYHFGSDGAARNGRWVSSGGNWYWIYYSTGKKAKNRMVDNGKYYVDKNGVYVSFAGNWRYESPTKIWIDPPGIWGQANDGTIKISNGSYACYWDSGSKTTGTWKVIGPQDGEMKIKAADSGFGYRYGSISTQKHFSNGRRIVMFNVFGTSLTCWKYY
ncbi:MAG: hypothetical protein PUE62_06645, partial [Coriobacteriaceae bacterium]|nr:hypothetical protein [Coriobacteriaceae bacterium]